MLQNVFTMKPRKTFRPSKIHLLHVPELYKLLHFFVVYKLALTSQHDFNLNVSYFYIKPIYILCFTTMLDFKPNANIDNSDYSQHHVTFGYVFIQSLCTFLFYVKTKNLRRKYFQRNLT